MGIRDKLSKADTRIYNLIKKEEKRQEYGLELIPSENYPSVAVMEAEKSIMMDKYAEGYPGKRYYGGCEVIDDVESLCIERACKLMKMDHCNVQSMTGSMANFQILLSFLNFGDTYLSMDLSHGGHLSHGSPVNFSGKYYNVIPYHVKKDTGKIDYEEMEKLAKKHKPKMILAGASAYPGKFDFKRFREIADKIDALLLADIAHFAGLVVSGDHPHPAKHCDFITSTSQKTLRGPRGGLIWCREEYAKAIDRTVFPGTQGGPYEHVIAAKAVCFGEALKPSFKTYGHQIVKNAKAMAKELMDRDYKLCMNGTDNHLMLMDFIEGELNGKIVQELLDLVRLSANKQMIPFDPEKPFIGSGVRLGTPAATTRGMRERQMKMIAEFIDRAIQNKDNKKELAKINGEVKSMCAKFPIYKPKRK
ncbi:serine hydroxymethyltransferase [Candidatus Undinarchaeota archaeon]